jgi:hypothetical protein
MSSPSSTTSSQESEDPVMEFRSPEQVEELYSQLVEKYNDIMFLLETYEAMDDDIQELREKHLDKYEHLMMAEAYEAAGQHATAEGCRNMAEECEERIEELQENIEDIDIKEHFIGMYDTEIKKDTYEIMMKACEKYLEKCKKRKVIEAKRQTIRPASPRRYPKAASPSRLNTNVEDRARSATPSPKAPTPKAPTPVVPAPKPAKVEPKIETKPAADIKGAALPLPPPLPVPSLTNLAKRGRKKATQ